MVNYAFANTNSPQIEFFADTSFGWAPLTVQFTDSSTGASEWLWRFGDGDSSLAQHPLHTYVEGGTFDVELEVTLPDGRFHRIRHDMILALGDTLSFGSVVTGPPGAVEIPVVLKNTQPLRSLEIPISYAGALPLNYQGWNTDGCRTENFEDVQLVAADLNNKKLVLYMSPGESRAPLPAGRGPVLNLEFYQYGTGVSTFDTTSLSGHHLDLEAVGFSYQPRVVAGHIYHGMCGNLDGDASGVVDLGDLTALIDYLFITLTPPPLPEQANVDGSIDGVVDLSDLTYMIAYLFLEGPPPVCP
jgi:PKD repeat protein